MRDENGIKIGRHHGNPILGMRVYEVKYLGVHKALLASNTISVNSF